MVDQDELFGTNTLRLTPAQWACTILVAAVLLGFAPSVWFKRRPSTAQTITVSPTKPVRTTRCTNSM